MAQSRNQQREVGIDEFMEAMCLERYAAKIKRQRASVSDLRNLGKKDLFRLGMAENEANRFSNCYKEWLATRSKPPDGEWRSLMDPSGNVDGLYQNASTLLKIGAVPNRAQLCNPRQQRSQTMQAATRPPYSNAHSSNSNSSSNAAVYSKVLQSVQQYLTPEVLKAPWFVQSVDHSDATRTLSSEGPGFFVVRLSAKSPGNFVLAYNVERQTKPSNAYIFGSPQGLYVKNVSQKKFQTLMEFVQHFSAPGTADTLPGLTSPLRVMGAPATTASLMTLGGSVATDSSTDSAPARSRKLSFDGFGDAGVDAEEFSTDGGLVDVVSTNSERARREAVPSTFDSAGQERVDVYVTYWSECDVDAVHDLCDALEAKKLRVWARDRTIKHLKTATGWRRTAPKMEAVTCQVARVVVVVLSDAGMQRLRSPPPHDLNTVMMELALQKCPNVIPLLLGDQQTLQSTQFPDKFTDHEWNSWTVMRIVDHILAKQAVTVGSRGYTKVAADIATLLQDVSASNSAKSSNASSPAAPPVAAKSPPPTAAKSPPPTAAKSPPPTAAKTTRPPSVMEEPPVPPRPSKSNDTGATSEVKSMDKARALMQSVREKRPSREASSDLKWFSEQPDAVCRELIHTGAEGDFIVRASSAVNSYVLCVKDMGVPTNYLMKYQDSPDGEAGYHFAERVFSSVPEIIFTFRATPFLAQSGKTLVLGKPPPEATPFTGPTGDLDLDDDLAVDPFWDSWQLEPDQLVLQRYLGEGEFGEVWGGLFKGIGEQSGLRIKIAVKKLKEEHLVESFLKEAKIMTEIDHPNLVKIYGVSTSTRPRLIISELCEKGSLKDFLHKRYNEKNPISEDLMVSFAFDICKGMAYLEDKNYIHRDLAARNVLVTRRDQCKVADFGFARVITEGIYRADRNAKMPIRWTAPEAIQRGHFTSKSDVYSYAITLYEVVTHAAIPYAGMTNKDVMKAVVHEDYRNPQPHHCSDELYDVMCMCWKPLPEDRPDFRSLTQTLSSMTDSKVITVGGFGDEDDMDDSDMDA